MIGAKQSKAKQRKAEESKARLTSRAWSAVDDRDGSE